MNNIQLMKKIWEDVYDINQDTTLIIEKYFHPDFEQCINGTIMRRAQYIKHVIAQKANFILGGIDYKENLERQNELFTAYYVRGKNRNNQSIEAEVIVHVRFERKKIIRVHGLVMLMKGNEKDIDM